MKFAPFNNRLCREIRNGLSRGLMLALRTKDIGPVLNVAAQYTGQNVESYHREYIEKRIACYKRVLKWLKDHDFGDVFVVTRHLWNEELFYEVHEYLEYHWLRASGDEKIVLQALIRAAGTYVHLEQGNFEGAAKMASKSLAALEANRQLLPDSLDPEALHAKLCDLDSVPPKLGRSDGD